MPPKLRGAASKAYAQRGPELGTGATVKEHPSRPPQNVSLINRTARSDSIFGWEPLGPEQNSPGTMTVTRIEGVFRGIVSAPYPALSLIACGGPAGFGSFLRDCSFRFLFAKNLAIGPIAWRTAQKVFDDPIGYALGLGSELHQLLLWRASNSL